MNWNLWGTSYRFEVEWIYTNENDCEQAAGTADFVQVHTEQDS